MKNPDHETQIISPFVYPPPQAFSRSSTWTEQTRIIKDLPLSSSCRALNEPPADDRVSFLEELPNNTVRELIKPSIRRKETRTLNSWGILKTASVGWMNPDYVYVHEYNTVEIGLQNDTLFRNQYGNHRRDLCDQ